MLLCDNFEVRQEVCIGIGDEAGGFVYEGEFDVGGFVADVDVLGDAIEIEVEGEGEDMGALLGDVDEDGFFVGVIFPGDGEVGMTGGVEPLVEKTWRSLPLTVSMIFSRSALEALVLRYVA